MPIFVNEREITDEDVFAEMQYHPAENAAKAMEAAARALVIRELLMQEAANLGVYDKEALPEDIIDKVLEKAVPIATPSEEECKRFYEQNVKKFVVEGVQQSFDQSREMIEEYIYNYSWNSSIQQYLKLLVNEAKIVGISMNPDDF
jgi:hypothetical protein